MLDDSTYTITYHRQAIVVSGGESPGAGSPFDDYTVFYPKHLLEKLQPKEFKNWELGYPLD